MAESEYKFLVSFDVQTGNLSVAKAGLEGMGQAAEQAGGKTQNMKNALGGIAELAKTVSIGAFLWDAAKTAAASSDAMDDLNNEWKKTIGLLVRDAAPALDMISKGLQGVLIIAQSVGNSIAEVFKADVEILKSLFDAIAEIGAGLVNLVKMDFSGFKENMASAGESIGKAWQTGKDTASQALDDLLTASGDASERILGITSAGEKAQSEIIVQETRLRLNDIRLSAEEKLAIIADGEERAIAALENSGEWQNMTASERTKNLLGIQKAFSQERETAQREAMAIEKEIGEAALQEQLDMLNEGLATEMEARGQSFEDRRNSLSSALNQELAILKDARKQGVLTEAQYMKATHVATLSFNTTMRGIDKAEAASKVAEIAGKANIVFGIEQQLASRVTQVAFDQAEKGKLNEKEFAREIIKTVAQSAANQIIAYYAIAAAKEVATKGYAGIVTGAILLALGAALAAGVAALGGAAARAIGGGGGGGGAAPAGEGAAPAGAETWRTAPEVPFPSAPGGISTAGPAEAAGGTAIAAGGPVPGAEQGPSVVVHVSMLDGTMAPETGLTVAAAIAKVARG